MASLIHNRILLYVIFLVALVDFLYLVSIDDIESASLFILLVILSAFFTKNMIIILFIAILITNLHKYGKPYRKEGLENKKKDSNKKKANKEDDNNKDDVNEKNDESQENEESEEKKLSVDNSMKTNTEQFNQDKAIITTTDEDRSLNEDKMMLAQEKMLERMNKYKPLLDTLNGLTKNIAIVKGLASSDE
jgi:FtsZ-interacting cell division protein ZipA